MPPSLSDDVLKTILVARDEHLFARLLERFPRRPVIVAEGESWFACSPQGTVDPKSNRLNEIHSATRGFRKILDKIFQRIGPLLDDLHN